MVKKLDTSAPNLQRRDLLLGAGAATALSMIGMPARAQSGELVVTNWGGDWNDRTVKFIEEPLVESKGIKIVRMLNLEPERKTKLLEMKKTMQPRIYPTHQQLAAAFANEEIWISANYSARIAQWAKDGVSVKSAYPKEGAVTIIFGAAMPKKVRNRDAAYFYLNALLDPKGLGAYSTASMYAPATTNAELSPEVRAAIDFTPEQTKTLNNTDYGYQAKNIAKWLEWWNKEFKG